MAPGFRRETSKQQQRENNFMTTFNRIKRTIDKFNDDFDGQVNLASPHARADLTELIYNAVMKQSDDSDATINDQQTFIFTNKTDSKPK
mgnify:CR=1 FL=1